MNSLEDQLNESISELRQIFSQVSVRPANATVPTGKGLSQSLRAIRESRVPTDDSSTQNPEKLKQSSDSGYQFRQAVVVLSGESQFLLRQSFAKAGFVLFASGDGAEEVETTSQSLC
jgi:hypothetical protein